MKSGHFRKGGVEMDVQQAINAFWNSFGVIAFDEATTPDISQFEEMGLEPYPRITYTVSLNDFGIPTTLRTSLWDKKPSFKRLDQLTNNIKDRLRYNGESVKYDNGIMWIKMGTPFSSHMEDPDDTIRRVVINTEIEYLEV